MNIVRSPASTNTLLNEIPELLPLQMRFCVSASERSHGKERNNDSRGEGRGRNANLLVNRAIRATVTNRASLFFLSSIEIGERCCKKKDELFKI